MLPLLFALLPCLTALLLLLAPISIANAVTLAAQQQRLETVRLRGFESQLDRVGTLIRQEKRLDQLIQRLQAIPGLSVEAPSGLSLAETRREALVSIKAERQRLRQQVQRSSSSSREALQRRSLLNAGQALVMGLVVWGCHHMAVNEMEQAIPYLQWALTVPDDEAQHATVLRELLEFQRRCVALSPLALLQLASRLLQQQPGDQGQASDDPETLIYDPANSHLYPLEPQAPARGRSWLIGIDLSGWWPGRRQATAPAPDDAAAGHPTTDGQAYSYSAFEPPAPPAPNAATIRRQRERASLEWQRMGEALDPSQQALQADQQPELPFQRARRRRRLQEQERARQALRSFGDYLRLSHGEAPEEILAEPAPPPGAADRPGWQRSLTAPGRWLRRALERLP